MPQSSKPSIKSRNAEPEIEALAGRYSEHQKRLAIAAVDARRLRNPRDRTIYREVADEFSVGEQSLRLWVKKSDADRSESKDKREISPYVKPAPSGSSAMPEEIQVEFERMRKQIEKLKAENEVLKRAFVVFSAEWGENG